MSDLTNQERAEIARLLREFQILLQSSIECAVRPGSVEAYDAMDVAQLQKDRLDWITAERCIRTMKAERR